MNLKLVIFTLCIFTILSCSNSKYNVTSKISECAFFDTEKKEIVLNCSEPKFKGNTYSFIQKIEIIECDTSTYHRDLKEIKISDANIQLPFSLNSYLQNEYKDRSIRLRLFANNRFLAYSITINPEDWNINKKIPFKLYITDYPH